MCSREYYEIFRNSFFYKTPRVFYKHPTLDLKEYDY